MSDGGDWNAERVAYGEVRAVLESQNEAMADIDGKAMRTVRFNVLLIGLLVTAAEFVGAGAFQEPLISLSIGSLVFSSLLGIVTYNESNLYLGPTGSYIERLARDEVGTERWDHDLVENMAGMVSENERALDWNSWLLTATQTSLGIGIAAGVLATAL